MLRRATCLLAGLGLLVFAVGCRVQVDKNGSGESKDVKVDTPFGGIHVNTDQTTAADLGLPVYPGARQVRADGEHKSADVQVGFGEWLLRVKAVSYSTQDSQEQVMAFYKKALDRYGDVITCHDNTAVGTPATTADGLGCDESKNTKVQVNEGDYSYGRGGLELKAGSRRHQHIVGFETPQDGKTRFALVAVDLPAGMDGGSDKSD